MKRISLVLTAAAFAVAAWGQDVARIVVTAEGRHGKDAPPFSKDDVRIRIGKEQVQALDWQPANGALQLLVLIDDGADTELGLQLSDMRKFMRAQPANVEIGVGYMRNGTIVNGHAFTSDHDAAAKSLRLPIGEPGAAASPYTALSETIKKWAPFAGRREVLMISSGIDPLYSGFDLQDPYLEKAIDDAQKAGIVVHSIYYAGAGRSGRSFYRINLGQSYLSRLGDDTGGEPYWQGTQSPVSFQPYLDDLTKRLANQYLLTFPLPTTEKSDLQRVHIRTEKEGGELTAASRVRAQITR